MVFENIIASSKKSHFFTVMFEGTIINLKRVLREENLVCIADVDTSIANVFHNHTLFCDASQYRVLEKEIVFSSTHGQCVLCKYHKSVSKCFEYDKVKIMNFASELLNFWRKH